MKSIIAKFFADVTTVCGHEKIFHANFCHHLLSAGIQKEGIAREYRIDQRPVDVVLFADRVGGERAVHDKPTVAIEFKGGAYNTRNALRDTIDADGHCDDLDKLLSFRKNGIECWFVCIDIAELGIVLSRGARQRVAANCSERGIHFAYYAQGEGSFLVCRDGSLQQCTLPPASTGGDTRIVRWQDCLLYLAPLVRQPLASEDTYTGMLYHALRLSGFGAQQLSLETYFNCAKGRTRMHQRPDICVFGTAVDGRFNLYREGNVQRSNDGIKIGNLQALIEVKGSGATERLSDGAFAKCIASDIGKLIEWRHRFRTSGYLSAMSTARQSDYIMITIDNRKKPMAAITLDRLHMQAQEQDIHFHYLSPSL